MSVTRDTLLRAARSLYTPNVPQSLRTDFEAALVKIAAHYDARLANHVTGEPPALTSAAVSAGTGAANNANLDTEKKTAAEILRAFGVVAAYEVAPSQFYLSAHTACMVLSLTVIYCWMYMLSSRPFTINDFLAVLGKQSNWSHIIQTHGLPIYRDWQAVNRYNYPTATQVLQLPSWKTHFPNEYWKIETEHSSYLNLMEIRQALNKLVAHAPNPLSLTTGIWHRGACFTQRSSTMALLLFQDATDRYLMLFDSHGSILRDNCAFCLIPWSQVDGAADFIHQKLAHGHTYSSADQSPTLDITEGSDTMLFELTIFAPV